MKTSSIKRQMPLLLVTLLLLLSIWIAARGLTNVVLLYVNYQMRTATAIPLMGNMVEPSMVELVLGGSLLIITWALATKVKFYQHIVWRIIIFLTMFFGIAFQYLWNTITPIYKGLVPYLEKQAALADFGNATLQEVLVGDTDNLMLLIMSMPSIVVFFIVLWIGRLFTKHQEDIIEWFKEWEYSSSRLQGFFKSQETEQWPDVALGPEKKSKEIVIQKGRDRTLNNVIIGPIGTGKTSSLILPIINQDLHHMTKMINEFPTVYHQEDYDTEKVKGMYLSGLSIIEPSNDLCQKAFELVKAHGIPEESVFYIDPTNPNTPAINPLKGPVEKVAEAVTMVIEGIGENTEFFFEQSQRNHLKYYIYLLKLHDEEFEPNFSDLIRMYNNPQVVRVMHWQLHQTIPENWKSIEDRDERNHWEIVSSVDEWFNLNLLPVTERSGSTEVKVKITSGEFQDQYKYYDAKAEFVVGLRNILDDISSNKLMRRVLFDQSDFDFDKHLEFGGVLLLNTAKGELGNLSNVLGKFVLLSLQNAVFRRKPNDSSFHHIICDEFPDYVYQPFKEFPAQSRKYKTIITVASQTLSQLADKYGDHYMQTLLGTLRHKMVFGDLTPFDADLFSKQLGEDDRFEESETEQTVSPLQENPVTRMGSSYSKVKEARLSPDQLIFQKAFECAVKLVENNEPKKVRQLTSNFVDKAEFQDAVVMVEEENASYWLEKRRKYLSGDEELLTENVFSVPYEDTETAPAKEKSYSPVDDNPVGETKEITEAKKLSPRLRTKVVNPAPIDTKLEIMPKDDSLTEQPPHAEAGGNDSNEDENEKGREDSTTAARNEAAAADSGESDLQNNQEDPKKKDVSLDWDLGIEFTDQDLSDAPPSDEGEKQTDGGEEETEENKEDGKTKGTVEMSKPSESQNSMIDDLFTDMADKT